VAIESASTHANAAKAETSLDEPAARRAAEALTNCGAGPWTGPYPYNTDRYCQLCNGKWRTNDSAESRTPYVPNPRLATGDVKLDETGITPRCRRCTMKQWYRAEKVEAVKPGWVIIRADGAHSSVRANRRGSTLGAASSTRDSRCRRRGWRPSPATRDRRCCIARRCGVWTRPQRRVLRGSGCCATSQPSSQSRDRRSESDESSGADQGAASPGSAIQMPERDRGQARAVEDPR
jgi:hypothetical protein